MRAVLPAIVRDRCCPLTGTYRLQASSYKDKRHFPKKRPSRISQRAVKKQAARAYPQPVIFYLGISTVSMTWITPLSAAMSVLMTLALFTVTPPVVAIVTSEP